MSFNFVLKEIDDFFKKFFNKLKNKQSSKKTLYLLSMFLYPSGNYHIGHHKGLSFCSVLKYYYYLRNFKVFFPLGWDSFGLPAEQASLKNNISPSQWTKQNIKKMERTLKTLNFLFSYNRTILKTSSHSYYKWDQFFFLKMFEKNLVYRKRTLSKYCKDCDTILSNEQSLQNCCWRCNKKISFKMNFQWFIRITQFIPDFLQEDLSGWDKRVIKLQLDWIGKKKVESFHLKKIRYFFLNETKEKERYFFFISDLKEKKFNLLYLIKSLSQTFFKDENFIFISSLILNIKSNKRYIYSFLLKEFKEIETKFKALFFTKAIFKQPLQWRVIFLLKDWCISRQRYWGTPIPLIECSRCGILKVKLKNLPVLLPLSKKRIVLKNSSTFKEINCFKCKKSAIRITDTMDTFFSSSWYMFRFLDFKNEKIFFEKKKIEKFLPIDFYIGGIEHAQAHLMFFRFFYHFCFKNNFLTRNRILKRLITQGMILNETFFCKKHLYLSPLEVFSKDKSCVFCKEKVVVKIEKMSKSKKNGISPLFLYTKYGSDALNMSVLYLAPIEKDNFFNLSSIVGIYKFLERFYKFCWNIFQLKISTFTFNFKEAFKKKSILIICTTIKEYLWFKSFIEIYKKIYLENFLKFKFNVVISSFFILFKKLLELKFYYKVLKKNLLIVLLYFILLLFPFAKSFCFFLLQQYFVKYFNFSFSQVVFFELKLKEKKIVLVRFKKIKIFINSKFFKEISLSVRFFPLKEKITIVFLKRFFKQELVLKIIKKFYIFKKGINIIVERK